MSKYTSELERINNVLFCVSLLLLLLFCVALLNVPEELENGCIDYKENIYCEVEE